MNLKVDKYLRKKAEESNDLILIGKYRSKRAIDIATKLAINETNGKTILDEVWEEYGSFNAFQHDYSWYRFERNIDKKVKSIDGSCLPSCNSSVERFMRSLHALYNVKDTFPKSPGLYLAYHFNRIFGRGSYIGFDDFGNK